MLQTLNTVIISILNKRILMGESLTLNSVVERTYTSAQNNEVQK